MEEDQGARGDLPLRLGVLHPRLRRAGRVHSLALEEAPADGGSGASLAGAAPKARRGGGLRRQRLCFVLLCVQALRRRSVFFPPGGPSVAA